MGMFTPLPRPGSVSRKYSTRVMSGASTEKLLVLLTREFMP